MAVVLDPQWTANLDLRRGSVYKKYFGTLSGDHLLKITQGRSLKVDHRFALHHLCVRALLAYAYLFFSALRAISFMRKRLQNQARISRKRSTPTRPATEQTPQITSYACSTPTRPATEQTPEKPSDAEATIHDPKSTPVLPRCDSAVEPDAAIEHIGMAWLSTIDDGTLIAIFEHLANCYAARPMVGTCKHIFCTVLSHTASRTLEHCNAGCSVYKKVQGMWGCWIGRFICKKTTEHCYKARACNHWALLQSMHYRILFVIECADVSAIRALQKESWVECACSSFSLCNQALKLTTKEAVWVGEL